MDLILTSKQECRIATPVRAALGVDLRIVTCSMDGFLLMRSAGVENINFLPSNPPPSLWAQTVRSAKLQAMDLDKKISQLQSEKSREFCSLGWEISDKFQLFSALKYTAEYLKWIDTGALTGHVVLLNPGGFGDYADKSSLFVSIWRQFLEGSGRKVSVANYQVSRTSWDCEFYNPVVTETQVESITHFPAAFYSRVSLIKKFNHRNSLDVQSPLFDIPVNTKRVALRPRTSQVVPAEGFSEVAQAYRDAFEKLGLGVNLDLSHQIDRCLSRFNFQREAYAFLRDIFVKYRPQTAFTTDVCGGLQAAFISSAKLAGTTVVVVPHSTITNGYLDLRLVDVVGPVVRDDYYPAAALAPNSGCSYLKVSRVDGPISSGRVCGVLLSEFDTPSGVPRGGTFDEIKTFLADITSRLEAAGWKVIFRTKPDNEFHKLVVPAQHELNQDRDALHQFINRVTAVISIVQPTSAIVDAWAAGKTVLVVVNGSLPEHDLANMPPSNSLLIDDGFSQLNVSRGVRYLSGELS